jgi:hypothetical protein
MKNTKWLLLSLLTLPLSLAAAHAAVNPDKLPQVPCSDLVGWTVLLDRN